MKSARGATLFHATVLALTLLGVSYWAWQRYHHPATPTYDGKTLEQWIADLDDPDYAISDRAADVLTRAGAEAVPILLDARARGDIRLHRRAAAVLIRIGAPAAPGLTAMLRDSPQEPRLETTLVRLGAAAVPALRAALRDDKEPEAAARILAWIGPPATDAVPDLIALLQRRTASAAARGAAAVALGHIGEPNAEIVPALSAALGDGKKEVRSAAADALGWIGPSAREALPALLAALKDEEVSVVNQACTALSFIGESAAAAPLVELFHKGPAETQAEAGRALWRLGAKAESILPALPASAQGSLDKTAPARNLLVSFGPLAVPVLTDALRSEAAARRETAAEILGRIGPPARSAVSALLAALQDKTPSVSLIAAMALAEIDPTRAGPAVPLLADALDTPGAAQALAHLGSDARAAVPALIAALKPRKDAAQETLLRSGAQLALARIGTPAVPALIQTIKDKKDNVCPLAAEALGWILPPPKGAIPTLRQAIADDRAHAAVYARALGRLGPPAHAALPDLTALLADADLRAEAALALVRIETGQADKVIPLLLKDIQGDDDKLRQRAADALAQMGAAAQAAAPALVEAVHDPAARQAALHALQGIGASAASSLAALLKDANVDSRRIAVTLLAPLGADAKPALPAILAALNDADATVRAGATLLIEGIGPAAAEAVPTLTANLQAYQAHLRYASASALGAIGLAAKEARRPLQEGLLDADEMVRYAAALALGCVAPKDTEAVPSLRDALHDAAPMVRLAAIDSLSRIEDGSVDRAIPILAALSSKPYPAGIRFRAAEGLHNLKAVEQAKQTIPWLAVELTDISPAMNFLYAGRVLARIDPSQAPRIVLALAAALRPSLPEARRGILRTLGEFGAKARAALPEIEFFLQDGGAGVREEAIQAMRAIHPARLKQLGID